MITLEANYSKKIGLPGYSSHQFSITLKTEISDINKVQDESTRLYRVLQDSVDASIQEIGFLPEQNGGNGNSHHSSSNGHTNGNGRGTGDFWACSDKQKELILKIVAENNLEKTQVEKLAMERFNTSVKSLNKLQASGLIKELLEKYPSKSNTRSPQRTGTR